MFEVARQEAVGGDHELEFGVDQEHLVGAVVGRGLCHRLGDQVELLVALRSVVDGDLELRCEAVRFRVPVADHGQRADHEVGPRSLDQVRQRGGRLAEAHVVGEAAAEAEPRQELHPGEATSLVVAEFADELARLLHFLESFVGQALEERPDPVGVGDRGQVARAGPGIGRIDAQLDAIDGVAGAVDADGRAVFGGVVVVGQLQELERGDTAARLFQFALLVPLAAQLVRVDADPAVAGVQQRGARLLGACQLALGDLLVADDEFPLDECLAPELLLAVVLWGRCGVARDAHGVADQALGADQLDAGLLQFERRDVDEFLGGLEVEFDAGRFVFQCEVGEAGHDRRDARDDVVEQGDERVEVAGFAGDFDGALVSIPQVGRRAPPHRVGVVDQFEADLPRVVRIVRHQEPHPWDHDGFARQPAAVAIEFFSELAEGEVEFGRAATHHVVGLGERAEHGSQRLGRALAAASDVGLPAALEEVRPGDAVDHQLEDLAGVVARPGGTDVRLRSIEGGEQFRDLVVELGGPSGHREGTFFDHDRRHPSG